jgi:hypothetical protein
LGHAQKKECDRLESNPLDGLNPDLVQSHPDKRTAAPDFEGHTPLDRNPNVENLALPEWVELPQSASKTRCKSFEYSGLSRAGEGIRTLDIQLGKLALCQLSYARLFCPLVYRFLQQWQAALLRIVGTRNKKTSGGKA